MNVEVKPTRYGDLIQVEGNEDYFSYFRLSAIGRYVLRLAYNHSDGTFELMTRPTDILITGDYPLRCYVDGEELLVYKTVYSPPGLTITRKG